MADNHENVFRLQLRRRAQRARDQRTAPEFVQNLGLAALHSRAETCGQDQYVYRTFHCVFLRKINHESVPRAVEGRLLFMRQLAIARGTDPWLIFIVSPVSPQRHE
jgi:hypothetical protein